MEGRDNQGFNGDAVNLVPGVVGNRKRSSFLTIDHTELNSHTYVYDANKSLQGMTVSGLLS